MIIVFGVIACKSTKHMENGKYYLLVLVNEEAVTDLESTYKDYKVSDVQRVSKSKFQYTASFVCPGKDCNALESKFKSDQSVVVYSLYEKKMDPVMSTKGSKAHRTGPVGSQGGQ